MDQSTVFKTSIFHKNFRYVIFSSLSDSEEGDEEEEEEEEDDKEEEVEFILGFFCFFLDIFLAAGFLRFLVEVTGIHRHQLSVGCLRLDIGDAAVIH